MSIEKDSLEFLEQRTLQAHEVSGTQIPVRLLPKDVAPHSLEKYLPHRCRYRGVYTTKVIADFARYAYKFPGGSCYIDQEKMSALQYFDLGTLELPGHGEHKATIKLERTAPFTALLQADGKHFGQKELAEWLEDWVAYLVAYSAGGDAIEMRTAIAAIRRITIAAKSESTHSQDNFRGTRTAMEEIEAKSEQGLPAGVRFKCNPYHGLDERSFEARLSVITSDTPKLVLRLLRIEEASEKMAEEFAGKLCTALKSAGGDADVYLGSFATSTY